MQRHEEISRVLQRWGQRLGYGVEAEPRAWGNELANDRLDLKLTMGETQLATDVSITHPIQKSTTRPGQARDKVYREKMAHYRAPTHGHNIIFRPFVLETTGALHDGSIAWLRAVSRGDLYHPLEFGCQCCAPLLWICPGVCGCRRMSGCLSGVFSVIN